MKELITCFLVIQTWKWQAKCDVNYWKGCSAKVSVRLFSIFKHSNFDSDSKLHFMNRSRNKSFIHLLDKLNKLRLQISPKLLTRVVHPTCLHHCFWSHFSSLSKILVTFQVKSILSTRKMRQTFLVRFYPDKLFKS